MKTLITATAFSLALGLAGGDPPGEILEFADRIGGDPPGEILEFADRIGGDPPGEILEFA